jgi:hypothetical protein
VPPFTVEAGQTAVQWPADDVRRVPVAQLVPYAKNARTHSAQQIAQIAASIKELGWTTPVLVDEDGGIIAGHGQVMAAKKLGIREIPVMTARGWSEAQKAYVLADNQLPMNAGWDQNLLKMEIREIEALNFDLNLVGFDTEALAKMFDEPPRRATRKLNARRVIGWARRTAPTLRTSAPDDRGRLRR